MLSLNNRITTFLFWSSLTLFLTLSLNHLLILSLSILIVDIIVIGPLIMAKEEDDYIWRMNNDPSSMNRIRFIQDEEGKMNILTWNGGSNGGYMNAKKKRFDRFLRRIN